MHIPDSAPVRIARRLVAHYGLSGYAEGRIGLVAQKLLDTAKNDESKVRLDDARAELIEMGFVA